MKTPSLDELESALGYRFARRELLLRALTHSSFAREQGDRATENEASNNDTQDNEELEFLGDAVLQLISTEELVTRYPGRGEGELSRLRAHLVNATHLRKCANALKLGDICGWGAARRRAADGARVHCWPMPARRCWRLCIWMAGWRRRVSL